VLTEQLSGFRATTKYYCSAYTNLMNFQFYKCRSNNYSRCGAGYNDNKRRCEQL